MKRANPQTPASPFGFLLVEGGDERSACRFIVGDAAWTNLVCWKAEGRQDLPELATLAAKDANFALAHSVGVVLDAEDSLAAAQLIAIQTAAALGGTFSAHGAFSTGTPKIGVFIAPDGQAPGCIETLCRPAVRSQKISACVHSFLACSSPAHTTVGKRDKGWLHAYSSMLDDPDKRFFQTFSDAKGIDPSHGVFQPLRAFLLNLATP
jgi:uncharacterized protein DUF3226